MALNTPAAIDRDTKNVVAEAQHLLKTLEDKGDAALADATTRVQDVVDTARRNLGEIRNAAMDGAKAAGTTADEYVHSNPWQAIGIGAAIGVLAGFLIARR
jgi:ElaB/YqjD/DUF883 family membrane-anchored ribosome-binding protein